MKKFVTAFVAALSLSVLGLTGCGGGGGENQVIENPGGGGTQMTADQQSQYEEYMKNQGQPGN